MHVLMFVPLSKKSMTTISIGRTLNIVLCPMVCLFILRIIYRSKTSYENAFLCTENDGMDMGYFINYHLKVMSQSFKELREYIQRKKRSIRETALLPKMHGLNRRQIEINKVKKGFVKVNSVQREERKIKN